MRFLCVRPSLAKWFQAARFNNKQYIEQHIGEFAKKFDFRETNMRKDAIFGIAAIHYAAMFGQADVLHALLEREGALRTQSEVRVSTALLPNARSFLINKGADVLDICITRGYFQLAREILAQRPSLVGTIDDSFKSHVMYLAYFPLYKESQELITGTALIEEFAMCEQYASYLQIICHMKRLDHLHLCLQILRDRPALLDGFYAMLVQTFGQNTVFNYLRVEIDYDKAQSARQNAAVIDAILMALLPQAIRALQADAKRHSARLAVFFDAISFEIPQFRRTLTPQEVLDAFFE